MSESERFKMTEDEMKRAQENARLLDDAVRRLHVPREQVPAKLRAMVAERDELKRELGSYRHEKRSPSRRLPPSKHFHARGRPQSGDLKIIVA